MSSVFSVNYLIAPTFVRIGQTADSHAIVNFISGLDVEHLNIEVTHNNLIDSYLLNY